MVSDTTKTQTVAVLGASPKEERYSNQAVKLLLEYQHRVIPIHPRADLIHHCPCVRSLRDIETPVDTLTVYVGKPGTAKLEQDILALKPRRIIINPGAENDSLEAHAQEAGIEIVRGCTLVMLKTNQF